jgi:CubicO group peptidase (beta-lactamase class C family)
VIPDCGRGEGRKGDGVDCGAHALPLLLLPKRPTTSRPDVTWCTFGSMIKAHASRRRALVCAALLVPVAASPAVGQSSASGVEARIARIERGLLPSTRVQGRSYTPSTIEARLKALGVPAVSVAVVNDGRVEWAKAYGVADVDSSKPATTATLFQAASMSKPVASMGALRLVQEGRLALDEPVNSKLRSWSVPANELTATRPVTLRGLLTHSAGLTVHGFPGYGGDATVPTVVQILNGETPANTATVRVDIEPGSRWRYSGGGMTVMQLLMSDVTGEPFPGLMRRLVLDPLGMAASTFEQPLPASFAAQAATAYRRGPRAIAGRYHTYPEMAAAGLWTTPSDLARWIIEVQRSLVGKSNRVLSREMTAAMLTSGMGGWGLGLGVEGSGDSLRFSHGGANEGFRGMFVGFAHRGQGAAVMSNSDIGGLLVEEILQAVAREYGWPGFRPREIVPIAIAPEALNQYVGVYALPGAPLRLTVRADSGRLMVMQAGSQWFEVIPTAADAFAPTVPAPPLRFERDTSGRVVALFAGDRRLERVP